MPFKKKCMALVLVGSFLLNEKVTEYNRSILEIPIQKGEAEITFTDDATQSAVIIQNKQP